jgi:hypothetical protein
VQQVRDQSAVQCSAAAAKRSECWLGGRLDFGSHKPPETINEGWVPFWKELRLSSFFVFLQQN